MLYENYKNVTDTGKANVINFAAQQFIDDVYNEYVDAYMGMQDYFDESDNRIRIVCDMSLSVYLRPANTEIYGKAMIEMCEWISKFLKCSVELCYDYYCDDKYVIMIGLDKNIFNMEV